MAEPTAQETHERLSECIAALLHTGHTVENVRLSLVRWIGGNVMQPIDRDAAMRQAWEALGNHIGRCATFGVAPTEGEQR